MDIFKCDLIFSTKTEFAKPPNFGLVILNEILSKKLVRMNQVLEQSSNLSLSLVEKSLVGKAALPGNDKRGL